MSIRKLPQARVSARAGLGSELSTAALQRWNPDMLLAQDDASAPASISILDVIGEDMWGEGVTAKRISGALRAIGEGPVVVSINSPGGDYFEGLAIYNALREHKGRVTVKVLGVAASAASVIAMAGDEIQIARAGFLMIHNTWVVAAGDRNALREVADWLEPFDQAAVDIYQARTGLEPAEITAMLDRETWIGGKAAVDTGFADALLDSDEISAGAQNSTASRPMLALHRLEARMAKAGIPKSERRDLIGDLKKGGMSGAAPSGMQDAAALEGVRELLARINKL